MRKAWLNAEAESEEMKLAKSLKLGDIVECWNNECSHIALGYYNGLSCDNEYPFSIVTLRRNIGDEFLCDKYKHIRLPKPFESEES